MLNAYFTNISAISWRQRLKDAKSKHVLGTDKMFVLTFVWFNIGHNDDCVCEKTLPFVDDPVSILYQLQANVKRCQIIVFIAKSGVKYHNPSSRILYMFHNNSLF